MYILAEDLVVEHVEVVGPDLGLGPRDADTFKFSMITQYYLFRN